MSVHPKKPCEICGQDVTTLKMARASHYRKHSQEELERAGIMQNDDGIPEVDVKAIRDPELQRRYERALSADAAREEAPEAFVASVTGDQRRALIEAYAPECLLRPEDEIKGNSPAEIAKRQKLADQGWSSYWGRRDRAATDAARACIPVLDEHDEQVTQGDDLLYRRRRAHRNQEIRAAADESSRRVHEMNDAMQQIKGDADIGDNAEFDTQFEKRELQELV